MSILSQNNLTRVEQGEQDDNLEENMDESELDLENSENFPGDSSGLILPEEIRTKPKGQGHGLGAVYKKYHCKECPYGETLYFTSQAWIIIIKIPIYCSDRQQGSIHLPQKIPHAFFTSRIQL
jgi:hypothetical protein